MNKKLCNTLLSLNLCLFQTSYDSESLQLIWDSGETGSEILFTINARGKNKGRTKKTERWGGKGVEERLVASWGTSLCCVNGHRAFICHYLTHGRRCTCVTHNSKQLNSAQGRAVTVHAGNIELCYCKKGWILFKITLARDELVSVPM